MKTLQEAIDFVAARGNNREGLDPEVQAVLAVRLAKYDALIGQAQHMRAVREMLENMWQATLRREVSPKDALFSLLANGILIGLEMGGLKDAGDDLVWFCNHGGTPLLNDPNRYQVGPPEPPQCKCGITMEPLIWTKTGKQAVRREFERKPEGNSTPLPS